MLRRRDRLKCRVCFVCAISSESRRNSREEPVRRYRFGDITVHACLHTSGAVPGDRVGSQSDDVRSASFTCTFSFVLADTSRCLKNPSMTGIWQSIKTTS